jgi:hypothetical protein
MERRRYLIAVLGIFISIPFAFAQEPAGQPKASAGNEIGFLLINFTNFARVSFLPPTNKTETVVQTFKVSDLKVNDHAIGAQGAMAYAGVRFTLPDWLDGDLKLNFFHFNPEAQRRRHVGMASGMFAERGKGLPYQLLRIDPDNTQAFWQRYPSTYRVYALTAAHTNLQAGQSYGLYIVHFEPPPPDLAFALTIDSERGRKEFGSVSYISGPTGISSMLQVPPRIVQVPPHTAFVQQNWTNFPMVLFLPPTNKTETAFQIFRANDHVIGEFEGNHYYGVRFTLPKWMDGDLEFAFVHMYRSPRELRQRPAYSWHVTAERGLDPTLDNTDRVFFQDLPETQARFPYTEKGYTGSVKREFLRPGQTYVFWWSSTKPVVPDMALAFSIISERGRKEFGEITWR